jgi:DNA primase large subunit
MLLVFFVRIIMSIEPNIEGKSGFTDDEIVDWFRQYDWFDEGITRYQVEHERRQTTAQGEKPVPIGCKNSNTQWTPLCIGLDECDYSIYQSLPFKDEVYERLDPAS